jgi:two-component system, chemotaxis family, CheB/CheR fusion protein
VRVNEAWRRFARSNGDPDLQHCGIGSNYLTVCNSASESDGDALRAHDGLRDVLAGRLTNFSLQYPCVSQNKQLWFVMHAAPVSHPGGGVVVSHVDITEWKQDPRPRGDSTEFVA